MTTGDDRRRPARFSFLLKASATSPTWAGMFLDFWRYQAMRSRIEPMMKIARTLRSLV
jgi:hypothetical protein